MVQVKKYGISKGKESENLPDRKMASRLFFYVLYKENQGNIRVFKKSEKRDCALFIWLNDLNRESIV